jgi:PAS domain S-box-containing protein
MKQKNQEKFPYVLFFGACIYTFFFIAFLFLRAMESYVRASALELSIVYGNMSVALGVWVFLFIRFRQYWKRYARAVCTPLGIAPSEKKQFFLIIEHSPEAIAIVNIEKQNTLSYVNGAWERLFGYSRHDAINGMKDPVLREIKKDALLQNQFLQAHQNARTMRAEIGLKTKDGKNIFVEMSMAPLDAKNKKIQQWFYTLHNVTGRKLEEEKMRNMGKKKMEFISIAVHKIRTPLTGIKWFIELLLKDGLSSTAREYVKQIAVSNERMTQLADDLLDVSHIETGRKFEIVLKRADVVNLAMQVIMSQKILAKIHKIDIRINSRCPKKLLMDVDADKIKKVFLNVINNAMKYSQVSGRVEVGCKKKEKDVVWHIKDYGIGIPKNQQSRIFEKFFRADNATSLHVDGTGLGLYICKAIIEGHGGNIWFESEEGKGSTFYFSLPILAKKKRK